MIAYRILAAALIAGPVSAAWAQAQNYPARQIRIVVPYTPGGFNDTLGRTLAQKFPQAWGQPAFVDNRPGGNTLIGTELVAKSAADGYTLLIVAFPFGANPGLFQKLPYDTVKDFAPVIYAASTANLLVVHPSLPAKSVKELIALAKARPGQITYASTGIGSSNHLSAELFKNVTHTDLVHVPYKGSAPAVTDLLGGHVQVLFDNIPNVLPQVKANRLRALAVTSLKRSEQAPEVPTVIEAGVPGYEVNVWFGVAAPAGTPRDIVAKLNAEINRILAVPDVKERFANQGVTPAGGTPEAFGEHLRKQIALWSKVAKDGNIKAE